MKDGLVLCMMYRKAVCPHCGRENLLNRVVRDVYGLRFNCRDCGEVFTAVEPLNHGDVPVRG